MKTSLRRWWNDIIHRRQLQKEEEKLNRVHQNLHHKTEGILTWQDYKHPWAYIVYTGIVIFLTLVLFAAIVPAIWLFISSFKTTAELYQVPYVLWPSDFNLQKLVEVWQYLDFTKYFVNSLVVVLGAVICSVVFNGILAYVISIIKPKGHKIVFGAVMLSYMIPAVTSIVPLFKNIAALNLIDSYIPLWFIFGANAFYFMMFKNYFDSIPKALLEAARLDGASDLQIFFMIVAPLSKPIMGVVAIFTTTAAWSDFLLPYLVLQDESMQTVMVKIFSIQSTIATNPDFGPDKLLMLLSISIIPQIILFIVFQKQITGTSVTSGMKE